MKNCDLLFTENGEISKQNKNPLKHKATFLLKNVNANRPSGNIRLAQSVLRISSMIIVFFPICK